MNFTIIPWVIICFTQIAFANSILSLSTNQSIHIKDFVESIQPGDIVILGESHAQTGQPNMDQQNQVELILLLIERHKDVSVGMEFVQYTNQDSLDAFLEGSMEEGQFKNNVNWGRSPFEFYREQILLPTTGYGWTQGLNAPRELTSLIGRSGITSLSAEESKLLPPSFELGNASYQKRFDQAMAYMFHHGGNLKYLFEAQSVWDDTMAWQAVEMMKMDPKQILVIIVGQFHVAYGGGLPDRIKARGYQQIKTVVQSAGFSGLDANERALLFYHPQYLQLADFFW